MSNIFPKMIITQPPLLRIIIIITQPPLLRSIWRTADFVFICESESVKLQETKQRTITTKFIFCNIFKNFIKLAFMFYYNKGILLFLA